MDLSIIIVSYNARADLERCLDSIRAAPPRTPHEVIVVDNASTDASADAARARAGVRANILAAAPATLARYNWPRASRDTLAVLEGSVRR